MGTQTASGVAITSVARGPIDDRQLHAECVASFGR